MTLLHNLPFAEYLALPGQSVSALKELSRSPLHFKHLRENPRAPSAAMALGTAVHCATLEPARFEESYAVWDRKTETGRAAPRMGKAWDAFLAELKPGIEVLTWDDHAKALQMAHCVRTDPVAGRFLETGSPEVTMQWRMHGRACKGRADWLTTVDGRPAIVGLKTTRDARPRAFATTAARFGYHLQWAWYLDGWQVIHGPEVEPWMVEIVVETEPPHAVVAYQVPPVVLDQGRTEYGRLLDLLAQCERTNDWPGPARALEEFRLPAWAFDPDDHGGADALDWADA